MKKLIVLFIATTVICLAGCASTPKCGTDGCDNEVADGHSYCTTHECVFSSCTNEITNGEDYCTEHWSSSYDTRDGFTDFGEVTGIVEDEEKSELLIKSGVFSGATEAHVYYFDEDVLDLVDDYQDLLEAKGYDGSEGKRLADGPTESSGVHELFYSGSEGAMISCVKTTGDGIEPYSLMVLFVD